jgi:hypothetical protein
MKKTILLVGFVMVSHWVYSQGFDIWSVWNYGKKEDATIVTVLSGNRYLRDRDWRCLYFDNDEKWGGWISYEGGGCAINQIIDSNENTVFIYRNKCFGKNGKR